MQVLQDRFYLKWHSVSTTECCHKEAVKFMNPKMAQNAILVSLKFKRFLGGMHPDPLTWAAHSRKLPSATMYQP